MKINTDNGLEIFLSDTRFQLTNTLNKSYLIIDSHESPYGEKQYKELFLLIDAIRALHGK